jgi:hypothetical protein
MSQLIADDSYHARAVVVGLGAYPILSEIGLFGIIAIPSVPIGNIVQFHCP